MKWLPPTSYAARAEWAKDHTWIAAGYFATMMSVFVFFLPVLMGSPAPLWLRIRLTLVLWPVMLVLMVVGVKHRWGTLPDAEAKPRITLRRPFSGATDRVLSVFFWVGVAGIPAAAVNFATGLNRLPSGLHRLPFGLVGPGCSLWFVVTTWQERRRRRAVGGAP